MKKALLLITTYASVALSLSAAQIHYYPFDSDANDQELTGSLNGTLTGTATITTDVTHEGAGALAINPKGGYVSLPTVNLGDTFSISAWINPSATGQIQGIFSNKAAGVDKAGFGFFFNAFNTDNGSLTFETGNGTTGAGKIMFSDPGAISFNSGYQHVAATVNRSTGTVILYANGNQVATSSGLLTDFNTDGPVNIGAFGDANFGFKGYMDEVRIYNTVLTPAEVSTLAIPEPSTLSLLGMLTLGTCFRRRR